MLATIEVLTPQALALARSQAQKLLEQARTDSLFRQQAATNPVATLNTFGFPRGATSHVGMGAALSDPDERCCSDYTCWASVCPSSCYATCIGNTMIWYPRGKIGN